MSKNRRIDLPEKLAKELCDMVDEVGLGEHITIMAWGFEIVLWKENGYGTIKGFLNDTSGG